jgi:hypothetical protein
MEQQKRADEVVENSPLTRTRHRKNFVRLLGREELRGAFCWVIAAQKQLVVAPNVIKQGAYQKWVEEPNTRMTNKSYIISFSSDQKVARNHNHLEGKNERKGNSIR